MPIGTIIFYRFILSRPQAVTESKKNNLIKKALAFCCLIVRFYYIIKAILRKQFAFIKPITINRPYLCADRHYNIFIDLLYHKGNTAKRFAFLNSVSINLPYNLRPQTHILLFYRFIIPYYTCRCQ